MSEDHTFSVSAVWSDRIHPTPKPVAKVLPLSIIDATTAYWSGGASCVWFYENPGPATGSLSSKMKPDLLVRSLKQTLQSYPHFSGQLRFVADPPSGSSLDHTKRCRRVEVEYGTENDPGVLFLAATTPTKISTVVPTVPSVVNGEYTTQWQDLSSFRHQEFMPPIPAALASNADSNSPCMLVQTTTFQCGGVALGIKLAHALSDARTLLNFTKDWASIHRAQIEGLVLPRLDPLISPMKLDNAAAGTIDGDAPDAKLLAVAQELPLLRYDLWASEVGCPSWMVHETQPPMCLDPQTIGQLGKSIPWEEWDLSRPVSHYALYFTKRQVERLYDETLNEDHREHDHFSGVPSATVPAGVNFKISRFDVLLAHLWRSIIRTRWLDTNPRIKVHLAVSFDVRRRLDPALPKTFIGSPVMNADVMLEAIDLASTYSLGKVARYIRHTVGRFNSATLPALLHTMAYEATPQRYWHAFMGKRHAITTSWHGEGSYNVDFVTGIYPRFVHPVMPRSDGIIQIMEAGPSPDPSQVIGHWAGSNVCVNLYIDSEIGKTLVQDPSLWPEDGS